MSKLVTESRSNGSSSLALNGPMSDATVAMWMRTLQRGNWVRIRFKPIASNQIIDLLAGLCLCGHIHVNAKRLSELRLANSFKTWGNPANRVIEIATTGNFDLALFRVEIGPWVEYIEIGPKG